jgi:hypothetical protein
MVTESLAKVYEVIKHEIEAGILQPEELQAIRYAANTAQIKLTEAQLKEFALIVKRNQLDSYEQLLIMMAVNN